LFVGFACSFGGKWFGGYARRNPPANFAGIGKRSVFKKMAGMMESTIIHGTYKDFTPSGMLVYCDPPYANTTKYSMNFDSKEFWTTMEEWSVDNTVLVSEYNAPDGWGDVLTLEHNTNFDSNRQSKQTRTEKVFKLIERGMS